MFKPDIMNMYQEIPKETLIKWVKLIIDAMHKDLKNQLDDYTHLLDLFQMYENNLLSIDKARKKALSLHQKARESNDPKEVLLYRIYGQAISTIHVKTHAFHVANYILKLYSLKKMNATDVFAYHIKTLDQAYEMTYQKQDDII